MTPLVDFGEAMRQTEGANRALLVGNGFSAQYFSYANLLDRSGLAIGSAPRNVFASLETVDFELVVRALEGAMAVEHAYGHFAHVAQLEADARRVREALVEAVSATHPLHREDLGLRYTSSAGFLERFSAVFSLNYDLLLYWVNLEERLLYDGFGLGAQVGSFIGPFTDRAYCNLYNLHGGLHLFDDGSGGTIKAIDSGRGVVATIADTILTRYGFPIYVAEGTSVQKMRKINSVAYLRHCYDMLLRNDAIMFVYGHSADENDAHVYHAIFSSAARHVYFGVYMPNQEKIWALDGRLAKFQRTVGSSIGYTFFDSESARVWGS